MITYDTIDSVVLPSFNEQSKDKGALDVLRYAYSQYGEGLVYACSFGIEGIVLIDLIYQVQKDAKIVFLDTNVHFQETYDLIARIKKRYPTLKIELKQPSLTLIEQAQQHGEELWKHNPNLCCHIRKVLPLQEVLTPVSAWISGLRREQSETRKHTNFLNKDNKFKNIKICPLIHWTWKDIWRYVHEQQLDYNPLHDRGYPSIGCFHCTSKANEDDMRSGRWAGKNKTECGLHES